MVAGGSCRSTSWQSPVATTSRTPLPRSRSDWSSGSDRRRSGGICHHQRPEHSQWGHCGDLGLCFVHVYGPRDRWQLHDSTRSFARDATYYGGSRRHLRRSGDPLCVSHWNHGYDNPSLRHRIRRHWKCVRFRRLGDVSVTSGQLGGVEPGVCSRRRRNCLISRFTTA